MWRNTYVQIFVAFFVFLSLGRIFPAISYNEDLANVILSLSTFTLAIFLSFTIARRHSRLSNIRELFRQDDAGLVSLRDYVSCFGKEKKKAFLQIVDQYLVAQLDYKLDDFERSGVYLDRLHEMIFSLSARSTKKEFAQDHALYLVEGMRVRYQHILANLRDRMLLYEWGSLFILSFVIWFLLLLSNDGSTLMTILIALISTSFVLFLAVLQDLDDLSWQQGRWIWQPLSELFVQLDLLPYFPEPLIRNGSVKYSVLKTLQAYRVATYPHPYPDMRGKKVKIVKK